MVEKKFETKWCDLEIDEKREELSEEEFVYLLMKAFVREGYPLKIKRITSEWFSFVW